MPLKKETETEIHYKWCIFAGSKSGIGGFMPLAWESVQSEGRFDKKLKSADPFPCPRQ